MKLKYSDPTQIGNDNASKLTEVALNICLRLLFHTHNKTAEEKEMWKLFQSITRKIVSLYQRGVVDLRAVVAPLILSLPTSCGKGYLRKFDEQISNLLEDKPFDLLDYSLALIFFTHQAIVRGERLLELCKISKVRSERKSILDELPCKDKILEAFKEIYQLETATSGREAKAAFANIYNTKLKPLLRGTFLFNPQNTTGDENDPEWETDGQINHRVYKRMAKLYSGWKKRRLAMGDVTYLIEYFEKSLWNDAPYDQMLKTVMKVTDADVDKMQKRLDEVRKYVATNSSTD